VRTPDGHGRVELTKFHTPKAISTEPKDAPANTLGIRRVMFAVDDIEDVVARLRTHGAELVGELVRYEDSCRLCNVRGRRGSSSPSPSSSAGLQARKLRLGHASLRGKLGLGQPELRTT
jgi:hypothetical protein